MKHKIHKKIVSLFLVALTISTFGLTQYNNPNSSDSLVASASSSSSSRSTYYYNTGTSLPSKAKYTNKTYNLTKTVKKGDILYEATGGWGLTGHSAIVEGIFYDSKQKKNYVRIIEAVDVGVKRGILDDTRMKEKKVTVLRLKSATSNQINKAVTFCKGQLNKKYALDLQKNTKSTEKDWYCSELVWAAYKNQGIDIESTYIPNEPGITPRDILFSNKLKTVLKYNN